MKTVIDEIADLLPGKLVIDTSNPSRSVRTETSHARCPTASPPARW